MEALGWIVAICVIGFVFTFGLQERKKRLKEQISSDFDDFIAMGIPLEKLQKAAFMRFKWRRVPERKRRDTFQKMMQEMKIDEGKLRYLLKYYDK